MNSVWQREKPTQMKNRYDHKEACRRVTARFRWRLLRQYVGHKIRSDPAYPAVYDLVRSSTAPLLDIGCGVGLLGFYLRERGFKNPIIGFDRDARKVSTASEIAAAYSEIDIRKQDLRDRLADFSGSVAMLDVLHYLPPADQDNLLVRLTQQIAPGAVLLLRDCPRDAGLRYAATILAEKFTQLISWNVSAPIYFPSRERIIKNFSPNEFTSDVRPLWGATPFNSYLFTFRRRASVTVSSAG